MKPKLVLLIAALSLPTYIIGALDDAAYAQGAQDVEQQSLNLVQLLFFGGRKETSAPPVEAPATTSDVPANDAPASKRKTNADTRNSAKVENARNPAAVQLKPSSPAMRKSAAIPVPPSRPQGDLTNHAQPVSRQIPPPSSLQTPRADLQAEVSGDGAALRDVPPSSFHPNILLLVRPGVSKPKDLDGSKVLVWRTDLNSEDLRIKLSAGAGVSLTLVNGTFEAALARLAHGEVDAVMIGVGPKLSEADADSLSVKPFRFLEIPM